MYLRQELLEPYILYQKGEKIRQQIKKTNKIISWKYAHEYVGSYITVEGKITDSYNSGKVCFLNFHKQFKTYISAVIFKPNFYAFPSIPEMYYKGKIVRISGTVSLYKGRPQIILTSKNQIKVVD